MPDTSRFYYTRVRESDGVPVNYSHESTFDPAWFDTRENAHRAAVTIMQTIMREREADSVEFVDFTYPGKQMRITLANEPVWNRYNHEFSNENAWGNCWHCNRPLDAHDAYDPTQVKNVRDWLTRPLTEAREIAQEQAI